MEQHQLLAASSLLDRANTTLRPILTPLVAAMKAVFDLEAAPVDPMISATARTLRIDAEKGRLRAMTPSVAAATASRISANLARAENTRIARGQLEAGDDAAEVRGIFRALDPLGQQRFMANAMQTQDGATVAAITDARPVLSGITADQAAAWRERYLSSVSGAGGRDEADEARQVTSTLLALAENVARPVGDPPAAVKAA